MAKKTLDADCPPEPNPTPAPAPRTPTPRAAGKPGYPDIHGTFGTNLTARND